MATNDDDQQRRVSVRKFGAGKSNVRVTGPSRFSAAATDALNRSFTTQAIVHLEQFRALMRKQGVPDDVIEEFVRSIVIDDESYLSEKRPE
jgi:hypothetical protein